MIENIFIFVAALLMIMKGATLATTHAARLAEHFHLSKYATGFIIVAIVSILPELLVSMNAALSGVPEFGLGTLLGSNVADLTLVFAITMFIAGRGMKIEGKILKHHYAYPFILILPIILGLDGYFSRIEGLALVFVGIAFYYFAFRNGSEKTSDTRVHPGVSKHVAFFLAAVALLLTGAHFTVVSATALATLWHVNPVTIGVLAVGLGTIMPELFFSVKSLKHHNDALAVGDVLGTVLADATIVIGLLALVNPFAFPETIIYVAGVFMVSAAFILFSLMRSGKILTRKEGFVLVVLWVTFVVIEFIVHDTTL